MFDTEGNFTFQNFSDELFKLFETNYSVIYKQFLKQDFELFKSIDYWKNIYTESLDRIFKFHQRLYKYRIDNLMFNIINNLEQYTNGEKLLSEDEIKFFRCVTLSFLDIYTLLRIFKQPTDGYRSSLTFCYFGYHHVNNISMILKSSTSGLYEIINDIPYMGDFRCKNIYFNLDLTEEVILHNERIDIRRSI